MPMCECGHKTDNHFSKLDPDKSREMNARVRRITGCAESGCACRGYRDHNSGASLYQNLDYGLLIQENNMANETIKAEPKKPRPFKPTRVTHTYESPEACTAGFISGLLKENFEPDARITDIYFNFPINSIQVTAETVKEEMVKERGMCYWCRYYPANTCPTHAQGKAVSITGLQTTCKECGQDFTVITKDDKPALCAFCKLQA